MKVLATSRTFIVLGALTLLLGVALGAFAAHGLKSVLSPELLNIFKTAVDYQFIHGLGLIFCGLIYQQHQQKFIKLSGWLLLAGIIIFSGSLYLLVITDIRWLGAITPLGGTAFILAWASLIVGMLKDTPTEAD